MSVMLELCCGGCDETTTVGPLRKRFHGTHGDWGFGYHAVDPVEELTPEGWVMFDPYTLATYCATCWAAIESSEAHPRVPAHGEHRSPAIEDPGTEGTK